MARRLRLHFASRRSSTDPLSESLGSHGEHNGVGAAACSPGEILAHNSVLLKVTALSPDYAHLQGCSSVFVPKAPIGGCSKKSIVQISLQPKGKISGDLNGTLEDGDPVARDGGPGSSSEGGSSSSMASDAGYCSSNSIFESEAPEKLRSSQERSQRGRKPRIPLRRCSSLVIFPKSPCNTPPASPVSPVAAPVLLPPARGSHQTTLPTSDRELSQGDNCAATCKGSANVAASGHRLKKESLEESKDTKHMVQFNIPFQDVPRSKREEASTEIELSRTVDRTNRHSSSLLLHFGQQRPMASQKGMAASTSFRAGNLKAPDPHACSRGEHDPARKLYRSTSACLFSSSKSEKNPLVCSVDSDLDVPEKKNIQRAIQRSFSLEVPYANTGILCHVSNPKLSSPCSPHVHIHLSPCYSAKLPISVTDANTSHKENHTPDSPNLSKKVSLIFLDQLVSEITTVPCLAPSSYLLQIDFCFMF